MTLEELKVGDTVILWGGGTYGCRSIETVQRTTPTQIIVRGCRFRKSDGVEICGYSFHKSTIHIPEDGEIEKLSQAELIQSAFRKCHDIKEMSFEMAQELIVVFEKYGK